MRRPQLFAFALINYANKVYQAERDSVGRDPLAGIVWSVARTAKEIANFQECVLSLGRSSTILHAWND